MAPAFLSYFGFGSSTPATEEDKTPIRALPASWYTSRDMYELERRAIFSRRWLLVTHKLRLNQPGEWVRFNIAGFAFFLSLDREGKLNGFHNVCRHRAYPVVEGADSGTAKIFACRYHGWSYGLNGKLAKAPGYQELDGFDKSKNSLFSIHVHTDQNGFIWVNFDNKETPEVEWEDDIEAVEQQQKFEHFNFEDYKFDHIWEQKGEFNWKILADNYNESYHASTIEDDEAGQAQPASSSVNAATTTDEQKAKDLAIASTYCFPNASMNVSPDLFFIQRFDAAGPTSTPTRYEVYRNKNASEDSFQRLNQSIKRILCASKITHESAQRNFDTVAADTPADNTATDATIPDEASPPLYFQEMFRDEIVGHYKREEKAKREIWPARQELPVTKNALVSQEDIDFCEGLACGTGTQEKLEW